MKLKIELRPDYYAATSLFAKFIDDSRFTRTLFF